MKKLILISISFLTFLDLAQAEIVSFVTVWNKISGSSAAQESSRLQEESLTESQSRAARHWLPKVYLDAKSYQTNDPGASFFGLLEQRAINQTTDFTADSINHPESHIYTRGALGLDLALYEGGMKYSQLELTKHALGAQKNLTSQVQIEQYSAVGIAYGSLAVLEQQKVRLRDLNAEVTRMIKAYQLGSKSNPVGYSGLLGMKSLANRISGLMNLYEAQSRSYYSLLRELGFSEQIWSPETVDSKAFVNRYFLNSAKQEEMSASHKIEAANENVKVSEEMANMEKAKFLPRAGAFAETFIFNGSRDTATGYNAGLYLQWSLYDPSNYGSLKEAKLKAQAAAKYSKATEQQESAERAALKESLKSLLQNIDLLNDSYNMLIEQSKMTDTLFKNGSINALQIVEILSRRTDLIAQEGEAELGLIKASAEVVTKQKFDISAQLIRGVKDEK